MTTILEDTRHPAENSTKYYLSPKGSAHPAATDEAATFF
ncbi:Serine/threonine protein kinase [Giardia duodenalis]|uniref:Serine/threonine protein kinase n=1 Tax=Giardia intestinalis TaxID=5741 RepID=V6U8H1_GIAIN|nr:Transporter, MFS superfamily protein [Giardia intestinalis]ESU45610.1 Serine/threonine protein kinase [Giardia intestinalis]